MCESVRFRKEHLGKLLPDETGGGGVEVSAVGGVGLRLLFREVFHAAFFVLPEAFDVELSGTRFNAVASQGDGAESGENGLKRRQQHDSRLREITLNRQVVEEHGFAQSRQF